MAIKVDSKVLKYQKLVIFIPIVLLSLIFLFAKFWMGMISILVLFTHFYLFCFLIPLYVFYYFFDHYFNIDKKILSKMAVGLVVVSYLNLFYKYIMFFYKHGISPRILNEYNYNLLIFPFYSFIQIMEVLFVIFVGFSIYKLGFAVFKLLMSKLKKGQDEK